jgi:hypothetical protein
MVRMISAKRLSEKEEFSSRTGSIMAQTTWDDVLRKLLPTTQLLATEGH